MISAIWSLSGPGPDGRTPSAPGRTDRFAVVVDGDESPAHGRLES